MGYDKEADCEHEWKKYLDITTNTIYWKCIACEKATDDQPADWCSEARSHEWEELAISPRTWECAACGDQTTTLPASLGCDHVWTWIADWGGDSTVPGGTFDASRWQCAKCGSDECEDEPPREGDEYEY